MKNIIKLYVILLINANLSAQPLLKENILNTLSNLEINDNLSNHPINIYDAIKTYNSSENLNTRSLDQFRLDSTQLFTPLEEDKRSLYLRSKGYYQYNEDYSQAIHYGSSYDLDLEQFIPWTHYSIQSVNTSNKLIKRSSYNRDGNDMSFPDTEPNLVINFTYLLNEYLSEVNILRSYEDIMNNKVSSQILYTYTPEMKLESVLSYSSPNGTLELNNRITYHHDSEGRLSYILTYVVPTQQRSDSIHFVYNSESQVAREETYHLTGISDFDAIKEFQYNHDGTVNEIITYKIQSPENQDYETFQYTTFGSLAKVERGTIEEPGGAQLRIKKSDSEFTYNDKGLNEELAFLPDLVGTHVYDYDNHNHLLLTEQNKIFDYDIIFDEAVFREFEEEVQWYYSALDPVSTKNLSLDQSTIFPNPSSSYIFLKPVFTGQKTVTFHSIDGKLMYSAAANTDGRIDVSGLKPGVYVYTIASDNLNSSGKFVKL